MRVSRPLRGLLAGLFALTLFSSSAVAMTTHPASPAAAATPITTARDADGDRR